MTLCYFTYMLILKIIKISYWSCDVISVAIFASLCQISLDKDIFNVSAIVVILHNISKHNKPTIPCFMGFLDMCCRWAIGYK